MISCFAFLLGAAQLIFLYNMIVSWRWGPLAGDNPWRAKTIEWLVSSPPPIFNFDEVPRVVGGPYEFGVPGARHAIIGPAETEVGAARARRVPARAGGPQPVTEDGGTILAFLNEVAGGRKLLETIRERVEAGAEAVALAAPQNQPMAGQIVDRDEVREAAQSRVEVTQAVLRDFGIEAVGAVLDPDPALALDDAVRAFQPREVLLSCLYDTRFGLTRKDLVEWAKERFEVPVTHIPVRIEDDAVRWDVTHALVVATQTVASADLIAHLKQRAAERPHRYTFISPPSGRLTREEVCDRLARTLAELYRSDIDATGQPMSPAPLRRHPKRDRALPRGRDPDLDPRRRAVEVAAGGADRRGQGDDGQARGAHRGSGGATGDRTQLTATRGGGGLGWRRMRPPPSITARPRRTRAPGSTARRSASSSSSSRR